MEIFKLQTSINYRFSQPNSDSHVEFISVLLFLFKRSYTFNKIQFSIFMRECTYASHWCWQLYRLRLVFFISTQVIHSTKVAYVLMHFVRYSDIEEILNLLVLYIFQFEYFIRPQSTVYSTFKYVVRACLFKFSNILVFSQDCSVNFWLENIFT